MACGGGGPGPARMRGPGFRFKLRGKAPTAISSVYVGALVLGALALASALTHDQGAHTQGTRDVLLPIELDGRPLSVRFTLNDTHTHTADHELLNAARTFCREYVGRGEDGVCEVDVAAELAIRAGMVDDVTTLPLAASVSRKLVGERRGDMAIALLEASLAHTHSVELRELLAAAYYQSEALDKALDSYQALVNDATRENRREDLLVYLVNMGVVLLDQGDLQEALHTLDRALQLSGGRSEDALYHKGKIHAYQNNHQAALEAYAALIRLSPTHADAYREMGLTLIDMDMLPEAAAHLQRALDLDPSDLGARHRLQYVTQRLENQRNSHVKFVTFASDPDHCGLKRLLQSAEYHGVPLQVLGLGDASAWANGSSKIKLLLAYLRGIPANQIVCVVDGYDVVFAGGPEQVLTRYRRFVSSHTRRSGDFGSSNSGEYPKSAESPNSGQSQQVVVFSADAVFFSRHANATAFALAYPPSPTLYRFLNSGSFIGPAGALLELVEGGIAKFSEGWDGWCDQTLFLMTHVLQHHGDAGSLALPRIELDVFQDMFGNTGGRAHAQDFDVIGGRLHNRQTDSFPIVLHSPGLAKFQQVFDQLYSQGWRTPILSCTGG